MRLNDDFLNRRMLDGSQDESTWMRTMTSEPFRTNAIVFDQFMQSITKRQYERFDDSFIDYNDVGINPLVVV